MYTYCLFCETNKTGYVSRAVSEMTGCRTICPKQIQHTWAKGGGTRDMVNDLMPGYIFLYYEDKADISLLHSVQGVIRCLSSTAGEYELTGQDEQFALMLLEKDGVIGRTKVYREGQMIRMTGPTQKSAWLFRRRTDAIGISKISAWWKLPVPGSIPDRCI